MTVIGENGGTVNVSRFQMYDIINDRMVESKRYATLPTIERIQAVRVGKLFAIPYGDINDDGMTVIGYVPVFGN